MTSVTEALRSFSRIIVWGLRSIRHSHRYIHAGFAECAMRMHSDAVWVDDLPANAEAVTPGSLVISSGMCTENLPAMRGATYVLHNADAAVELVREHARWIILQVWTADVAHIPGTAFDPVTKYDDRDRVLYQPWGTSIGGEQFLPALSPRVRRSPLAIFVGSVWNNEHNQGNRNEISSLRRALAQRYKLFLTASGVSDAWHPRLIRVSSAAPAVGGRWQSEVGYLPCRLFKNVSFGHLGVTNIPEFKRIFGDAVLTDTDLEVLMDAYFALPASVFSEMTHAQQEICRQHTYEQKLANIVRALDS